jgi:hypothetical protein
MQSLRHDIYDNMQYLLHISTYFKFYPLDGKNFALLQWRYRLRHSCSIRVSAEQIGLRRLTSVCRLIIFHISEHRL